MLGPLKEDSGSALMDYLNDMNSLKFLGFIDVDEHKDQVMSIIKDYPEAIQFVDNPPLWLQLEAVVIDSFAIEHIRNPHKSTQMAAVSYRGDSIQFIDDPDHDVKLAAVKQNGTSIKHIKNPSDDIQMAAVKRNFFSLNFIDDPIPEAREYASIHLSWPTSNDT